MEEISLREIIEIILKGKKFIIIVTLICLLVGITVSTLVMDPTYEAQTMLMISPITTSTNQNKDTNNFSDLVETLSKSPEMTIDTYREQVKAPVILQYIRKELGNESIPLKTIANKISVQAIKNTNLLTINVTDSNPEQAAKVANLVSKRFTEFVSETNKKKVESSAQFIVEQMEKEKTNLKGSSEKLKEFLSKPRGPSELSLELESKLKQLTEFKTQILQIKVDEQAASSSLQQGKKLLRDTPKTLFTNKTLINDDLLLGVLKDSTGLQIKDLSNIKLTDEQTNEIFVVLSSKVNELELELSKLSSQRQVMDNEILTRQKEIEVLQTDLAQKQQEYDILQHEVDLIKQTYDAYQQKYKEAMIMQSAEVGKSSIAVISEAVPPISPVGPKKVLNTVIAAFIGLCMSSFVVFIKHYWNVSEALISDSKRAINK